MRHLKLIGFIATILAIQGCDLKVDLPESKPVKQVVWADGQNWSQEDRFWFHHTTQGTVTLPVPYQWFIALEQPSLSMFSTPGLLKDPEYLSRFGFISSPKTLNSDSTYLERFGYTPSKASYSVRTAGYSAEGQDINMDELPVGFARLTHYKDPVTGEEQEDGIGFTCAACHTGQLEYKGTSVRIDGAPAIIDLLKFNQALGLSLFYTQKIPGRFGRFADRVLGAQYTKKDKQQLKKEFDQRLKQLEVIAGLEKAHEKGSTKEGFARLDALTRIGNQVFSVDLLKPDPKADNSLAIGNYATVTAPVSYPQIWNTSWFDWVQYDASIMQPMVRNAGEALGVMASVNMIVPDKRLYDSSVRVHNLYEMEQLLAGKNPFEGKDKPQFQGLLAPKWPQEVLGEIDEPQKEKGKQLYETLCQSCHFPPVDSPDFWDQKYWTQPNDAQERYLKVNIIPIEKTDKEPGIGTDPGQANAILNRNVKVPEYLKIDPDMVKCDENYNQPVIDNPKYVTETNFGLALGVVVQKVTEKWYANHGTSESDQKKMNGYRDNCIQALSAYKARPLDGIWATAPYLHNGSVPSLYDLLSPVAERPKTFWVGNREFDPNKVGYETSKMKNTFKFKTTKPGNSNSGHEFRDAPDNTPGVIGRYLEPEERWVLVEYLKSL